MLKRFKSALLSAGVLAALFAAGEVATARAQLPAVQSIQIVQLTPGQKYYGGLTNYLSNMTWFGPNGQIISNNDGVAHGPFKVTLGPGTATSQQVIYVTDGSIFGLNGAPNTPVKMRMAVNISATQGAPVGPYTTNFCTIQFSVFDATSLKLIFATPLLKGLVYSGVRPRS